MNVTAQFLTRNFSLVLIVSFLLGLFLPGLNLLPKFIVLFFVASLIFLACAKITLADMKALSVRHIALFYAGRFIVFPWMLYEVFHYAAPYYAHSVLLLSLIPAGSSAPALTAKAKGNPALALSLTVIGTLLAPFVVPVCFWMISGNGEKGGTGFAFNVWGMFFTLSAAVFLPVAAYVLFARLWPAKAAYTRENAPWLSTLALAFVVALTVAIQRQFFFRNLWAMAVTLAVLAFIYAVYYAVGWYAAAQQGRAERVAYTICSGANNNSLAASIALFYLTPQDTLFMVLSEAPWVIGVIAFQRFMLRRSEI